jgi:predicted dehydrogenase
MRKIKFGWIGAGFVGQAAHLDRFTKFENVNLIGLAELRPKLGEKVAKSFNINNVYSDHLDLLKMSNCEAIVAIVNRRHTFEVAKSVLESKKHLLTEKPMAQTYDQAKVLADLAKKNNLMYSVGFMRRYDTVVRNAKNIIKQYRYSNELGELLSVKIFVEAGSDYCGISPRYETSEDKPKTSQKNIAPDWIPTKKKLEYEHFVNVCSHDINLLRFLIEEPVKITAVDYRPNGFSYALMDFGNFPGIFEWGIRTHDFNGWKEGVEIKFSNGQINLSLPPAFLRNYSAQLNIKKYSSNQDIFPSELAYPIDYTWSFENSDKAFVKSILENKDSDHSGKDAFQDFKIIDNIWKNIV